jgi:hypothetical protein
MRVTRTQPGAPRKRTTIGLKTSTKDKLDNNRAPGQCYDGFICQLVDLWEIMSNKNSLLKGND